MRYEDEELHASLRWFATGKHADSARALDARDALALLAIAQEALRALERVVMVRTDRYYDSFNDPEPDEPEEIAALALTRCADLARPGRGRRKTAAPARGRVPR
jgi:hypothetical protein